MLVGLALLVGCDQVARHKVLSTVFDGVPQLPPAEALCEDYLAEMTVSSANEGDGEVRSSGSSHRPYAEKECRSCHESAKNNALITTPDKLCFICHVDFVQGSNVHGPVSVGDCLACHLPHTSKHASLLQKNADDICAKCHVEERLAAAMHKSLKERGMACVDCHDAHAANGHYFLN